MLNPTRLPKSQVQRQAYLARARSHSRYGWQNGNYLRRSGKLIAMYFSEVSQSRRLAATGDTSWFLLQDVVVHECTSQFLRFLLEMWLPEYEWHMLIKPSCGKMGRGLDPIGEINSTEKAWLLSPHQFGWPMSRPRLFTVGIKKESVKLNSSWCQGSSGLEKMRYLFVKPNMNSSCFFCAPSEARRQNSFIISDHCLNET